MSHLNDNNYIEIINHFNNNKTPDMIEKELGVKKETVQNILISYLEKENRKTKHIVENCVSELEYLSKILKEECSCYGSGFSCECGYHANSKNIRDNATIILNNIEQLKKIIS